MAYTGSSALYMQGGDIAVKNNGVADIAADLVVLWDSSNVGDQDSPPGVKLPTNSGGVVGTAGITCGIIKAGKSGLMRVVGSRMVTAHGTVTMGEYVQASDTTSHLGQVKTCIAATEQIGQAMGTATDAPVEILICKARNA
jgi:hypothetical protein